MSSSKNENKKSLIFKAKTSSAHTIKVLIELLTNSIKTACFEISDKGIGLSMMDNNRAILIELFLDSENFISYKLKKTEKMFIGINLSHFLRMIKSCKKKDSLQLFISDENPDELGIKVIPKENNRITTSYIKIQDIQTLTIESPTDYTNHIIVPSSDFQKLMKDMAHIGQQINIVSRNSYISFKCNNSGIIKREVEFGDNDDSEDDEDENEYNKEFNTEQLSRIGKIAGLHSTIQIYTKNNLPLLLKTNVGTLGKISIFIKSIDLINEENL